MSRFRLGGGASAGRSAPAQHCSTCRHWRGGCGHPWPESDQGGDTVASWQARQNITSDFDGRSSGLLNPRSSCPGWQQGWSR